MREVLLHGGSDDAFDRSVVVARRMTESSGSPGCRRCTRRSRKKRANLARTLLAEARCAVLVLR